MTSVLAGLTPTSPQHVAWREAAEDVRLAYRAWCDAARDRAAEAYAVYVAAADREAAAADGCRAPAGSVLATESILTAGLGAT